MIVFKQKEYSEYDAMRLLYVTLRQSNFKVDVIDKSQLIPVLRGNSVVIEKFVVASQFFGKDKFRMYLKVGARAKFPDGIRIPSDESELHKFPTLMSVKLKGGIKPRTSSFNPNDDLIEKIAKKTAEEIKTTAHSDVSDGMEIRLFGKKKKNKGNGGNNGGNNNGGGNNGGGGDGGGDGISWNITPNIDFSYETQQILAESIKTDKISRSITLEFRSLFDAVKSLGLLPFGLNYHLYLLDS